MFLKQYRIANKEIRIIKESNTINLLDRLILMKILFFLAETGVPYAPPISQEQSLMIRKEVSLNRLEPAFPSLMIETYSYVN